MSGNLLAWRASLVDSRKTIESIVQQSVCYFGGTINELTRDQMLGTLHENDSSLPNELLYCSPAARNVKTESGFLLSELQLSQ